MPLLAAPPMPVPGWLSPVVSYGGCGVTLFFVVSAFSLCLTWSGHERTGAPLVSFYIKRYLRIAPLFTLVAAWWVVARLQFGLPPPTTTELVLNATFLFNLLPSTADSLCFAGWTIGVEALFYLVFPLLRRRLDSTARRVAFLVASLGAYPLLLGLLDALHLPPATIVHYRLLSLALYLPAFAAGMLAHDLYARQQPGRAASDRGWVLIAAAASLFAFLVAGQGAPPSAGGLAPAQWQAVCFGMLLLGVAWLDPQPTLGWLPRALGVVSYSAYLLHGPILIRMAPIFAALADWAVPATVRFAVATAVTLTIIMAASVVGYALVERPCLRLSRRIVARWAARGASAGAVRVGP